MSDRFTVVGAGLAGALMGCYLSKAGRAVHMLERRSDPRATGGGEGRSINLAISTRALRAFDEVGITAGVLGDAVPMRGRVMHDVRGQLSFQPYGTEPHHVINSVSRGGLNCALLDAAESLGCSVTFEAGVTDLDLETGAATWTSTDGSSSSTGPAVVIGADGASSAVRQRLQRSTRFDMSQTYLEHGYKELTIPAGPDGAFLLERDALHIWPRGGFMMIALPNADGSFTCTLFWPFTGPNGLETLTTSEEVTTFFERTFPDAVPLMPDLAEEYLGNRNSGLVTVRSGPWYYKDRLVLIGDACHAVVPFYGQGANAAFEDCTVLNNCLHRADWDCESAFRRYYQARKRDADALADLAIANFVEMRDKVASPWFRARKRWEKRLHRLFPRLYIPLYSMITFSTMSYADAARRARNQDRAAVAGGVLVLLLLIAGVAVWL